MQVGGKMALFTPEDFYTKEKNSGLFAIEDFLEEKNTFDRIVDKASEITKILGSGLLRLPAGFMRIGAEGMKSYEEPLKFEVGEVQPGMEKVGYVGPAEFKLPKALEHDSKRLFEVSDKLLSETDYTGDWLTPLTKGNAKEAGKQLFYGFVHNAPQLLLLIGATAMGQPELGLATLGTSAAGSKYRELEQREDVGDNKKYWISILNGIFETATEKMGTERLAEMLLKNPTLKRGVTQGFVEAAKSAGKNYVQYSLPEAAEEFINSWAGNITDKLAGISDKTVGEMTAEAINEAGIGGVSGFGMGTVANIVNQIRNAENIRDRKKAEQMLTDFLIRNRAEIKEYSFNPTIMDPKAFEAVQALPEPEKKAIALLQEGLGIEDDDIIYAENPEALGPHVIHLFPESQTYLNTETGEIFIYAGEETELPSVNRKVGPAGEYLGNEIDITPKQTGEMNRIDEERARQKLERTGVAYSPDNKLRVAIIQHPSGEGYAVEVTREGKRELLDEQFADLESARNKAVEVLTAPEIKEPEKEPIEKEGKQPEKTTESEEIIEIPEINVGDRVVYTNDLGETFEGIVELKQEAGEGHRFIVRRDDGTTFKAFDYKGTIKKLKPATEEQIEEEEQITEEETPKIIPKINTVKSQPGTTDEVKLKTGESYPATWAIVEADDINTSHDINFRKNPDFPEVKQPRADRGDKASVQQIMKIYSQLDPGILINDTTQIDGGPPVIDSEMDTLVGNARMIALKKLYNDNHKNAELYKQYLKDRLSKLHGTGIYGIDPLVVDSFEKPVLVRVIQSEDIDNVERLVQIANDPEKAVRKASGNAVRDAKMLTPEIINKLVPEDDGEVDKARNKEFITAFRQNVVSPEEANELFDNEDNPSQAGVERIKKALFYKAYGDTELLNDLAVATDSDIKNILTAMEEAAPHMVKYLNEVEKGNLYDRSIVDSLVKAVKAYKSTKTGDITVNSLLHGTRIGQEGDRYGLNAVEKALVRFLDENKRSRTKLRTFLTSYVKQASRDVFKKKNARIGKTKIPTRIELLQEAENMAAGQAAGQISIFAERAARVDESTEPSRQMRMPMKGYPPEVAAKRYQYLKYKQFNKKLDAHEQRELRLLENRYIFTPQTMGEVEHMSYEELKQEMIDESVEPIRIIDIDNYIRKNLYLALNTGRMLVKDAFGRYRPREESIRVQDYGMLETRAHELGHHFSQLFKLPINKEPYTQELVNLLVDEGLNEYYDKTLWSEEGCAEFFRYYFTQPSLAKVYAPEFFNYFENFLDKLASGEHELAKNARDGQRFKETVKAILDMYQRYYSQPAEYKVAAHTGTEIEEAEFLTQLDRIVQKWLDPNYVLKKALIAAGVNLEELNDADNPLELRRLLNGVTDMTYTWLKKGQYNWYKKRIGPSLHDILVPVKDYINWDIGKKGENRLGEFQIYLLAKAAQERIQKFQEREYEKALREKRKPRQVNPVGIDPEAIDETVKKLEKEHPEFIKVNKQIQKYKDNLIDILVDSGFLAKEDGTRIKNAYKWHVPMYRVFGNQEFSFTGGSHLTNIPTPIKRAFGSHRPIIPPLLSIIKDTEYILTQACKNEIKRQLVDLIKGKQGTGYLIEGPIKGPSKEVVEFTLEDIKEQLLSLFSFTEEGQDPDTLTMIEAMMDELGEDTLMRIFRDRSYVTPKEKMEYVDSVRRNGHIVWYQFHPDIYEALDDIVIQSGFLNFFGKLLKPFKFGAVIRPGFFLKNILRDNISAPVFDKEGNYKPIISFFRGLINILGEGEEFAEWKAAGGSRAGFQSFLQDYQNIENLEFVMEEDKILHLKIWKTLQAFADISEESTRAGAFIEMKRKLLREAGYPEDVDPSQVPDEQWRRIILQSAIFSKKGVGPDFSTRAKYTAEANKLSAFFAAAVSEIREFKDAFRKKDGFLGIDWKHLLKTVSIFGLMALADFLKHKDDEKYWELPSWRRHLSLTIFVGDKAIPVPIGFLPAVIFYGIPKSILEWLYTKDPRYFEEIFNPRKGGELWTQGLPNIDVTLLTPVLEVMANYSVFFNAGPIDPESEMMLKPEERYSLYTSEVAKVLGKALKMSPRRIDHLMQGWLGPMAGDILDLVNFALGQRDVWDTFGDISQLFYEPLRYSGTVDTFYQKLNQYNQIVQTYRYKQQHGQPVTQDEVREYEQAIRMYYHLQAYSREMAAVRRQMRMIEHDPRLPFERKEELMKKYQLRIMNLAREALGKKPIIGE